MDKQCLLNIMGKIAHSLMTTKNYTTDFTEHDVNRINQTEAKTPFIWIVREAGTWLFWTDDKKEIERSIEYIQTYMDIGMSFYLFSWDTTNLQPIYPKKYLKWVENELKNAVHEKD